MLMAQCVTAVNLEDQHSIGQFDLEAGMPTNDDRYVRVLSLPNIKRFAYITRHLAVALLVAVTGSGLAFGQERPIYFPLGTWPNETSGWPQADQAIFLERWYGDQLYAMGENSLSQLSKTTKSRHIRVLVLPSFAPAVALHLVQAAGKEAKLKATVLNGAGGYAPGTIDQQQVYDVNMSELATLSAKLEDIDAWRLGTPEKRQALCTDGTMIVLEMALRSYFHAIQIHNCELLPQTEALIAEFFALAPEYQSYCGGCTSPWSK